MAKQRFNGGWVLAAVCGGGLVAGFAGTGQAAGPRQQAAVSSRRPAVGSRQSDGKPAAAPKLDFDRDVRPILAENCFACHGFDPKKRQANLRLDTPDGAYAKLESGSTAVIPGKPKESELVQRIESHSMPPASSGKKLTDAQIATLKRWVAGGGKYAPHWAFVAPVRPALPAVKNEKWCLNPIDRFILARLEKEGMKPSPAADRRTLIRRVTFDLTGLPPTPAEVEAFVFDQSPDAYEKVVDRLLASPHYGEEMALRWLDVARYADTHGFHIDSQRDMWPWRDWVIHAYNSNKPFDQFTIEQLAGDLIPNATRDQKIASGFNRNHPINFEGGAIPEEYQAAYIFDRIDTTATVWMGLTLRCGQCHDHKYDPLSQREFYQFYAFFNNIAENGLDGQTGNAAPFMKVPSPEQEAQLASFDKRIAELDGAVNSRTADAGPRAAAWEKEGALGAPSLSNGLLAHYALDEASGAEIADATGMQPAGKLQGKPQFTAGHVAGALSLDGSTYADLGTGLKLDSKDHFSYGGWVYATSGDAGVVISRMDEADHIKGWDLYIQGGKAFVHMIHEWDKNAIRVNTQNAFGMNQWHHVFVTYDGSGKAKGVKIYVDGKPQQVQVTHDSLTGSILTEKPAQLGRRSQNALFKGKLDEIRVYGRELSESEVGQLVGADNVRQIVATAADKRTQAQKDELVRFYLTTHDETYRKLNGDLDQARKDREALDKAIPTTMVMQERPQQRDTFMLVRGQYNVHGDKVTPGVPAVLGKLPDNVPANRLALAKWLVDPKHPLTARVAVNRYWQDYFGIGLVRTAENFGTQGERPTHPELLDWLATEFIRTGWDIKAMQRLIVTSNTYKQRSQMTPELLHRDPENRLLARGPRYRLPGEAIRDQALAVSGLLVDHVGGPSVKPYQPKGLWEEIAFGGGFSAQSYEQDHGDKLYRRSMYTFWKRTCPPPSLQTFDAPEREFCMVRRSVTNTPLQALVLMNDTTFVEASRKFAERVMTDVAAAPADRVRYAYRLLLDRPATGEEIRVLTGVYEKQLERFRKDPEAAKKLVSVGESPRNEKLDACELAAWTGVANVMFNMDEVMTKN